MQKIMRLASSSELAKELGDFVIDTKTAIALDYIVRSIPKQKECEESGHLNSYEMAIMRKKEEEPKRYMYCPDCKMPYYLDLTPSEIEELS